MTGIANPIGWGGIANGVVEPMQGKVRDHSIDHMRALAAALVLYWHGIHQRGVKVTVVPDNWILSIFEEGWIGVTLFIAITGFIFTTITVDSDIDYLRFLRNRVLRILPLMFIIMLFHVTFKKFETYSLLLFFNLLGGGLIPGAWTLAVEFQFYTAYPYLRNRLVHDSLGRTVITCLGLALFFLFFRYCFFVSKGHVQALSYWTIFGQIDAFLSGIIGGLIYMRARKTPIAHQRKIAGLAFAISGLALLFAMSWFNARGGFYGTSKSPIWLTWLTLMSILCGTMITTYAILMRDVRSRISRWLGYIGEISYSTYLLHFLTLGVLSAVYGRYVGFHFSSDKLTNETLIIALFHYPLTLLLSAISYEVIEKSFHHKTDYLRPRESREHVI